MVSLRCNIDKVAAIVGAVASLWMITIGAIYDRAGFLTLGVLIMSSCLIWLLMRGNAPFEFQFPVIRTNFYLWSICFFLLYALSVLSIYFRPHTYERPLLYFILISLAAGAIACEILIADRRHIGLILVQIFLLGMSIGWSHLFIVSGVIGKDPWYHMGFTNLIISEHYIPDNSIYSGYEKLPLFHLMIALTSLVTGLPYKYATMASVSFGQIVCNTTFVFLIANYAFKNYRMGLLSALLVVIASHHILMSYLSIPNAFGAIFIFITLYLIFSKVIGTPRAVGTSKLTTLLLLLILMVAIIFTHSIVTIFMAILFFVILSIGVADRFFHQQTVPTVLYLELTILIIFIISMLAWWIYSSGHIDILVQLIEAGFDSSSFVRYPELRLYRAETPFMESIYNVLGLYAFLSLSLVGVLFMISQRNHLTFLFALISITPALIAFIFNISGGTVIEERWFYFSQVLLSIPLMLTLFLVGGWLLKKPRYQCFLIFGFIVIMSFVTFTGTFGSLDCNEITPSSVNTLYYSQSEMIGSGFIGNKVVGVISSDVTYCVNPSSSVFMNVYNINQERLQMLDLSYFTGEFEHDGSIKVIRAAYLNEIQTKGLLSDYISPDESTYLSSSGFDKIYDNSAITAYTDKLNVVYE